MTHGVVLVNSTTEDARQCKYEGNTHPDDEELCSASLDFGLPNAVDIGSAKRETWVSSRF